MTADAPTSRDLRLVFVSVLFWGFGSSLFLYIQPLYVASLGAAPDQIGLALGRFLPERRLPLLIVQILILTALLLWLGTTLPLFVALAYLIHGRNRLSRPFLDGRLSRVLSQEELNLGYSFREIAMRLGLSVSPYVAGILYTYRPGWPIYTGILCLTGMLLLTLMLPTRLEPIRWQTAGNRY